MRVMGSVILIVIQGYVGNRSGLMLSLMMLRFGIGIVQYEEHHSEMDLRDHAGSEAIDHLEKSVERTYYPANVSPSTSQFDENL